MVGTPGTASRYLMNGSMEDNPDKGSILWRQKSVQEP